MPSLNFIIIFNTLIIYLNYKLYSPSTIGKILFSRIRSSIANLISIKYKFINILYELRKIPKLSIKLIYRKETTGIEISRA